MRGNASRASRLRDATALRDFGPARPGAERAPARRRADRRVDERVEQDGLWPRAPAAQSAPGDDRTHAGHSPRLSRGPRPLRRGAGLRRDGRSRRSRGCRTGRLRGRPRARATLARAARRRARALNSGWLHAPEARSRPGAAGRSRPRVLLRPRRDGPPRTRAGAALRRRMAGVRARGGTDDAYRAGHRRRRARACLPRTARRAHRPGSGLRRDALSWQLRNARLARRRDGYPRTDRRARADRALNLERAAERADAVDEPAQSRASRGVNTTAAVVAHLNHRLSFAHRNPYLDLTRVGVLSGIRNCFDGDEIRGRLHRRRVLPAAVEVELDRHRRAAGHGRKRGLQAPIGEDAGMDPASEFAEFLARGIELGPRDRELAGRRGVRLKTRLETSEVQRERDEPLLSAVVEITLDASPRGVGGLDDAGSRGGQLLTQSHRALSLCAEAIPESTVGPPPMTWSAVDGGHVRFVVALAGGRGEIVEPFD